jgi:midasin (ATPase involved in ribosome maturation)
MASRFRAENPDFDAGGDSGPDPEPPNPDENSKEKGKNDLLPDVDAGQRMDDEVQLRGKDKDDGKPPKMEEKKEKAPERPEKPSDESMMEEEVEENVDDDGAEDNGGVEPPGDQQSDAGDADPENQMDMDLPEDLNLDDEATKGDVEDEMEIAGENEVESGDQEDAADEKDADKTQDSDGMEDLKPLEEIEMDQDPNGEDQVRTGDDQDGAQDPDLPQEPEAQKDKLPVPDRSQQPQPSQKPAPPKAPEPKVEKAQDMNQQKPKEQAKRDAGVQGPTGAPEPLSSATGEGNPDDNAPQSLEANAMDAEMVPDQSAAEAPISQSGANENPANQRQGPKNELNPYQSLGDTLKKWYERLAVRQENLPDNPAENAPEPPGMETNQDADDFDNDLDERGQFEFAKEDEGAHGQTLAPAESHMSKDLTKEGRGEDEDTMDIDDGRRLEDDEADPDQEKPKNAAMPTMPEKLQMPEAKKPRLQEPERSAADLAKAQLSMPTEGGADEEDDSADAAKQGKGGSSFFNNPATKSSRPDGSSKEDMEVSNPEPQEAEAGRTLEEMREELQEMMDAWQRELVGDQTAAADLEQGHAIWQRCVGITHDLSAELCEQLRLILEPTLAAKLQGDYRTGKRLNMRKVISYIASGFQKDKIWLRRTKPSKREYQVLIALDDSRSMSEFGSSRLALESLALIAGALSKLEIGGLGVISFGDRVNVLHPFEESFSDDAGARMVSQLRFDKPRTRVRAMVEQAIVLFEEARRRKSMSGRDDLWQLQLIISDGVCEDHESLRNLLRRAMEERIFVAFIVLDTRADKSSITTMNQVSYRQEGGKTVLQMTRYMDTFPFDFYVVLRDIASLPGVLSEALRQWFEMVSR